MTKNIKLMFSFIFLSLSFISLYSEASTCPPVESIKRVTGEYLWVSTEPGWTGYFFAPKTGKGRSYKVTKFINASWVKAHDTIDSTGFVQCDYAGDFLSYAKIPNPDYKPGQSQQPNKNGETPVSEFLEVAVSEVIRFTQSRANGAYMPSTARNANRTWTCTSIVRFPGEACVCYGEVSNCSFRMG